MSLKIDRLQLEIVINNDQARKSLRALEDEARQLQKELKRAPEGTAEWDKLNERLKQNKIQHDKIIESIGIEKLTLRELTQRQKELNAIMRNLDPSTKAYKDLEQQMIAIKNRQGELRTGMNKTHFSIQNMAQSINKYWAMVTVGIATVTGAFFSVKTWIKGLTDLDDALANVRKTTGLTLDEVRALYTEFKYLNTRTPRKELLALAEEAGRLGKSSKKDIMDFVEVANQISVALGDDLQGNTAEATKEVGKLTDIYRIGTKYGTDFRDSMLMMGSAINEVSANSQAEAPFLIDILKRMGGISQQAGMTAQDVIGLASTLDQLGQTAELSSTALNKVILNMFKDPGEYASIANVNVEEFTSLLKTDANEALLQFLTGLNGNNAGLSVMADKLDGLGLDGARAVQVLASLSGNVKLVREQQDLANKSLEQGTSLTNEYNIKNNNMAGNLEKIGRSMYAFFVNSSINKSLESIVSTFAKWFEIPLSEKLEKERTNVNLLIIEMTNANTEAKRRNEIYQELKELSPKIVEGIDLENISVGRLTQNLALYNEEMINKIALEKLGEKQAVVQEDYGEARANRIMEENKLMNQLFIIQKAANNLDKTRGDIIGEILLQDIDVLEKEKQIALVAKEINDQHTVALISTHGSKELADDIVSSRGKELKLQKENNNALEEYKKMAEELYKETNKPTKTGTSTTGGGDTTESSASDEYNKTAKAVETLKIGLEGLKQTRDALLKQADEVVTTDQQDAVNKRQAAAQLDELIKKYDKLILSVERFSNIPIIESLDLQPQLLEFHQNLVLINDQIDRMAQLFNDPAAMSKALAQVQFYFNSAAQALDSIFQIQDNKERQALMNFEASQNKQKEQLNARLDAGEISYDQYTARLNQLDVDLDKKKRKVEHDAAIRRKKSMLFQAIGSTALAILNGLNTQPFLPMGIIMGALAGILGGLQIAAIASEPVPAYAQGNYQDVVAQNGKKYRAKMENSKHKSGLFGEPTYVPGFGMFGETPKPELVFNPEDTQKLINSPGIIDAINYTIGSRAFANGNSKEIIRESKQTTFTDPALIEMLIEMKKAYEKPSKAYLVADEDYLRTHEKEFSKYNDFQNKVK